MNLQCIAADSVAPQAWRNAGGQTRELLAWPSPTDWSVRVSLADIAADGPFSPFPGVQRWFAVVQGAGVRLDFAGTQIAITVRSAPLCFDGAQAPGCSLLAGPTRDLNLMCRDGACSMRRVEPEVAGAQGFAARGLFCAVAGRWTDGQQCCELQADTLLWSTDANAAGWSFVPAAASPDGGTAAWWLGFTPAGASA